MVSFDVSSLYTNIPIINTLNIFKDYVSNDDQLTRKTSIPLDKFFDLVNLVLATIWSTFNSQFYQQTDSIFNNNRNLYAGSWTYCNYYGIMPSKRQGTICSWRLCYSKRTHLENFFHHINNLHQNIKFTVEEESNGERAFFDTLLKRNNGNISVLASSKPTHTD